LAREDRFDLALAKQTLRNKQFTQAWDARGCGGSSHRWCLNHWQGCSSADAPGDFRQLSGLLLKLGATALIRRKPR
jgi:hypothetical protein